MHILITGAAHGIGAAITRKVAQSGNILTLVDIDQAGLDALSAELGNTGIKVNKLVGDLADNTFLEQISEFVQSTEQPVEVLVNNAAIAHYLTKFTELTDEDLGKALGVNINAPFKLIQAVLPRMQVANKGLILNFASRANIYGYELMGIYAASKAAITSFTGTVALENKDSGVKTFTIIPGRTNTQMQTNLRGEQEAQQSQSPDYVAEIVAKLINGEIPANSGDSILISFGEYKVLPELDKAELHRNMN